MDTNPITFKKLVNLDELRSLFEDFSIATGFSVGLVETETHERLLEVGLRDICRDFHRAYPASAEKCFASRNALQSGLNRAGQFRINQCEHGFIDGCTPIVIQGRHAATLFTGQIFFTPPDLNRFKQQALKYDFDEEAYLQSLALVPIVSEENFSSMLRFLANTIEFSVNAGLTNIKHHRKTLEKENQLRSILSVAPAGIGLIIDRHIQWTNKRMEEMVGYSSAELQEQNSRLLYASDEEFEWVGQEKYTQIQKNGTGTVDTGLRAKDGSIIEVELSSTPLDQHNLSAGVIFTATDITERNRARRNLENSEQQYRELFNNMSNGVAIYSAIEDGADFIIDDMNTSALQSSRVKLQDVLGKKATEIFPGIKSLGLFDVMQRVWETGKAEKLPSKEYRDDKLYLWVENYVCKLPSGQVVAIYDDISERKRFENEIIRSKEEWENTFDAMVDIVTIQDSNLEIVRANKAAHQFFAAAYGELNGKKCYEIFRGITEPCTGCPLLETLQDADSHSEDMTHVKLGKIFQVSSSVLVAQKEKPQYLVHVARDITEQERLQEEANRSQRLASLGELAAGVAHEINNPNGAILYNSEMLQNVFNDLIPALEKAQPENNMQRFGGLTYPEILRDFPDLLADTREAALRIKRIVTDLRDFSRHDGSEAAEPVDLNQVVVSASRLAGNTIKSSTDNFSLDLAETLPPVQGISARLEQVILNLLLNACQALENSSQKICITTSYQPKLAQVQLQVTDEGRGISADMIDHVLDPFVTTKREQGGTGLGLSVSARIVKEHQGRLTFESTPGRGTTVTLILPAPGDQQHAI